MGDYISKVSVCEILGDIYPTDGEKVVAVKEIDKAYEAILHLPDIENRPKGKWIKVTNGRGGHECNLCHNYAPCWKTGYENPSAYCPNCGADMRGEK